MSIESVAQEFNIYVRELVKKALFKSNNPELRQIKARLNLAISSVPLSLIEISAPFIWKHRKIISGIYNKETKKYQWEDIKLIDIGGDIDEKSVIIIELVNQIFDDSTEDEKIDAYSDVVNILGLVAQYRNIQHNTS